MISKRGNGIRWMATNKVLVVLLSVLWGVMPCERYGYCLGARDNLQKRVESYQIAPSWQAVEVHDLDELMSVLSNPSLGWEDQRTIQVREDIILNDTLVIKNPIRLEGNCAARENGRCVITSTTGKPLIHIDGPSALVMLGNFELKFGKGTQGMGGAVTVSNYSQVDVSSCEISRNAASSGGAIVVMMKSHANIIDSFVSENIAAGYGGGFFVSSDSSLNLLNTVVTNNEAKFGGGIYLSPGAVLASDQSVITGNTLQENSKIARGGMSIEQHINSFSKGSDILLGQMENNGRFLKAKAYFRPVPDLTETFLEGGTPETLESFEERGAKVFNFPNLDENNINGVISTTQNHESFETLRGIEDNHQSLLETQTPISPITIGSIDNILSFSRRALQQSTEIPPDALVTEVTGEAEFAEAIKKQERFVNLTGHIVLSGQEKGDIALLPSIKASMTVEGNCQDIPYGGKCLLNGQALGAILFADNSFFVPGMELVFKNIVFLNGRASGSNGGAFANKGAMSVTFVNCDFVYNTAGSGGAVALIEGAFSIFSGCTFRDNTAAIDGSGPGTGGAVLLTGSSGFTRCTFENNIGNNGGAVGVGGSSQGIFFETCNFKDNKAEIFGNDVYLESWVATGVYFRPFPTEADVYTTPENIRSLDDMPPMYYPASVASPPPSPPAPPSPPPPPPPSPPNPKNWIYTEDQLWNALDKGNSTIILGAHIQFAKQGRWAIAPPPTVISSVRIISKCDGYGETCIIDLAGSRFPLFDVRPGGILKAYNIRIVNGATMENGGAVRLNDPLEVLFESCDFIGNYAVNGGAVTVKTSLPVSIQFKKCNFGMNYADENGGAVYSVGATITFKETSFYLNYAKSGGAIGLGPGSTLIVLDGNFTRNKAQKWGSDIFFATPVGSLMYVNQWPPERVASIFPVQAQVQLYTAPPPFPPAPPSPELSEFRRAPYPPPGSLPPVRLKRSPPSPPNPPPFPPPRPPSPPMDVLVKKTPIMWAPMYSGAVLVICLIGFVLCAIYNRRVFPRIEDPDELVARLAGEYIPPSDEDDVSVSDIGSDSDNDPTGGTKLTLAALAAGSMQFREGNSSRKGAQNMDAWEQSTGVRESEFTEQVHAADESREGLPFQTNYKHPKQQ